MTPAALLTAAADGDGDARKQLVQTIVVVLVFIPIFWSMRRKVRSGTLAPVTRRTNPHSRTYIVVLSSLNLVIIAFFAVSGVLAAVKGSWALAVSLLLLGGLLAVFVWMLLRQGSELRRHGLPDRAPSPAQKHMSRPRRVTAFVLGTAAGAGFLATFSSAYDGEWTVATGAAVMGGALFAVSWWLYKPAREAEKAGV